MSITLAQLRTKVRQRADMENSNFITDSEINGYINSAIAELYDLLVASYGEDYYTTSTDFTTANGQDAYTLPNDFYKLRGVDLQLSGDDFTALTRFNWNERNRHKSFSSMSVAGYSNVRYRLRGGSLIISPTPDGARTLRLWYVPVATALSADGDTFDDINQWGEFVVLEGAIRCLQKEESDVSILMAQKADIRRRIEVMGQNRDEGTEEGMTNVYETYSSHWESYD